MHILVFNGGLKINARPIPVRTQALKISVFGA